MAEREAKQVIVIRRDLGMRRGKEIAQGAHASMAWLGEIIRKGKNHADGYGAGYGIQSLIMLSQAQFAWLDGSFTKVTCQAASLEELEELEELERKALEIGIPAHLITDAGRTEFGGVPTVTALAIGPDWSGRVDEVTGHLKLY